MKIVVLADTHVPVSAKRLPSKVYDALKGCDLIIHAGDIVELSLIRELEKIAPTKAVRGNMDSSDLKDVLPEHLVVEVDGKRIGVTHGKGPSFKVIQTVGEMFDKKVDVIIFGHSHTPLNEKRGSILYFNPGSPTDKIFAPYRSFGVIEIADGEIKAEIVKIED